MATKRQETHQRMIDAAGQSFRQYGYDGIGVDGIAKAAGVTSGAFYAHFGSKDGAFKAALIAGLDEVIAAIPEFQTKFGANWLKEFTDYYLGRPHRADLACGCAMASLTTEVVRSEKELHEIYEKKMHKIAALIAAGLSGPDIETCMERAWATLGILIGGLNMARAMKTGKAGENVAEIIKASALKTAGKTKKL